MNARQRRATRGLGAATVAVVLAAVSHTVGGGSAPAPLLLVAALALAWPLATLVVGRRVRLVGQTAAVIAAQAVLHALFALTGSASPGSSGMAAGMHGHDGGALLHSDAALTTIAPTLPMLAAHLVAAVAALVLVRHGEAALAIVAHWFAAALAAPAVAALPRPVRTRSVVPRRATVPAAPPLGPATRRGPPALSR